MPNHDVPAVGGAMSASPPCTPEVARIFLHEASLSLYGLRADVQRELREHARCRRDVEALIERLIGSLDALDGESDFEPFDEGDVLDAGEAVNEDGDDSDGNDFRTPETHGMGLNVRADEAAKAERSLWRGVAVGVFASFKRGHLVNVRAVAGEGRARA